MQQLDLREVNSQHLTEFRALLERETPRLRKQFLADVDYSYLKMLGWSVCRQLQIPTRAKGNRRVAVLDIGFGAGIGIEVMRREYRIDEDCIVGLEVIPEHYEAAKRRWPKAHFYLLSGDPGHLGATLKRWADSGTRFQVILARHVMEHQHPEALPEILEGISRLLVPGQRGSYMQVTPDWRNDPEPAHLSKLPITWTRPRGKKPARVNLEGWPALMDVAGLRIVEAGRWRAPAHANQCEFYISAISSRDGP